jgi:hypothetical protein
MDYTKIHDSQLIDGEKLSLDNFLDSKLENGSLSTEENSRDPSLKPKPKFVLPKYSFKIV